MKSAAYLLLACTAAGCSPGATPVKSANHSARIFDAIRADEVRWNADWRSGNPAKVARHYAPDAVVMVPGLTPMTGGPAVLKGLQESFEQPGFLMSFASDTVQVAASGDLAVARGAYKMTVDDPKTGAPVTTSGSYVTVYKPQPDGSWKAAWDITTPGPVAAAVGLASR